MIAAETHIIKTSSITVPPDRQRQEFSEAHIENLYSSISDKGLIHPIVLTRDNTLVVGECRLRAWKKLEGLFGGDYLSGIPARYTDELDPNELRAIELEENIQRKDLAWQEESLAFLDYYAIRKEEELKDLDSNGDPVEYTWSMMSGNLNCSDRHCRRMVQVGRAVKDADAEVLACQSARAAGAILERRAKRIVQNELVTFGEVEATPASTIDISDLDLGLGEQKIPEPPDPIINYLLVNEDFKTWQETYTGPKFNFIHCDFPYGIGLDKSDLYKMETSDLKYEDEEETYWDLCQNLVYAQDTALSKSCHVLFWFPMSKYTVTVEFFKTHGFRVEPYPLIWMKADKMGIIPDPTRGPRRIYETALLMSLGDRKIIKPTVNGVHCSSSARDKEHASQKPKEMLEDFLRMFIDEDSIVLDPTCGSGTALAASISLGAKAVLGLDISPESVRIAEDNCRNEFTLKLKE